MGDFINSEMIRGHIDTIILLSLVDGDRDSNEIRADIEKKSENRYSVKQGTFYSAMKRLTKQNYIKEYRSSASDGIRRKYYSLTEKGKRFLDKNREDWLQSKELIDGLIETPSEPIERGLPKTEKPADEFEKFKELASDIGDYRVEDGAEEESYLDRLGSDVFADIQSELDALNVPVEDEPSPLIEEETLSQDETAIETVMGTEDEESTEETVYEDSIEISEIPDETETAEEEVSEETAGSDETSDREEESDSPYVLLDSMEENSEPEENACEDTEEEIAEQDDIYEVSDGNAEETENTEATEEYTETQVEEDGEPTEGETEEDEEIIDRDLLETQQELDKLLGIEETAEETIEEIEPENGSETENETEEIAEEPLSEETTEAQAKENVAEKENEDPEFLLSVTTDHDFTAPAYDDSAYRVIEETDEDYIHIRGIIDERKTEEPSLNAQTDETEEISEPSESAEKTSKEDAPETESEEIAADDSANGTEKEYVEPVDAENAFKGFNIIYNKPQEELFTANDFAAVEMPEFPHDEEIPEESDLATSEAIPQENYETSEPPVSDVEINIISQNAKIEEKPIVIFASSDYDFPSPTEAEREEPQQAKTESAPTPTETTAPPSPAPQAIVTPQEEEDPAEDDYLYAEDGKPAMQREYKSILSKLFPRKEEKEMPRENVVYASPEKETQPAETAQTARTVDLDEYFARATQKHYEETYRNYEDTYAEQSPAPSPAEEPQPEPAREETSVSAFGTTSNEQNNYNESVYNAETAPRETKIEKQVTGREALSSDGTADFSDLYAMANREGFKIRTSSATNRFSGKYILANKLNMNTAWLFFILLFGEMALMNCVFAQEVGWSWMAKGSIVAAAFLVPLILTIRYFVSGNNKVTEIAPFRSAMEVSLIITFQIVIIVLAVALFSSIDFNSHSQVLSYIAIPCIFALNIPVFFILKYLLLESGKYFTK